MECHPMFCSVYISLIVLTAGFVLTICSWLAPPLTDFVGNVRILGLIGLAVGGFFLSISCIVAALNHGKCCRICYKCNEPKVSLFSLTEMIANPLVSTTAIVGTGMCADIMEDEDEDMIDIKTDIIQTGRNNSDESKRGEIKNPILRDSTKYPSLFLSQQELNTNEKDIDLSLGHKKLSQSDYKLWNNHKDEDSPSNMANNNKITEEEKHNSGYVPLRINDSERHDILKASGVSRANTDKSDDITVELDTSSSEVDVDLSTNVDTEYQSTPEEEHTLINKTSIIGRLFSTENNGGYVKTVISPSKSLDNNIFVHTSSRNICQVNPISFDNQNVIYTGSSQSPSLAYPGNSLEDISRSKLQSHHKCFIGHGDEQK